MGARKGAVAVSEEKPTSFEIKLSGDKRTVYCYSTDHTPNPWRSARVRTSTGWIGPLGSHARAHARRKDLPLGLLATTYS